MLSTNTAIFILCRSAESTMFVLLQTCHRLYKKCSSHLCLESCSTAVENTMSGEQLLPGRCRFVVCPNIAWICTVHVSVTAPDARTPFFLDSSHPRPRIREFAQRKHNESTNSKLKSIMTHGTVLCLRGASIR